MRRLIAAFFLTTALAGCFQSETIVRVRADGSGTIEQVFTMSKATVAQMRAFSAEMGGEPFTLMDVEKLEAQAAQMGEGVRFVTAEPISDAGGEGYRAVYAFTDVTALRLSTSGPDLGEDSAEPTGPPITFAFEPGSPATLTIRQPQTPEPDSTQIAQQEQHVEETLADSAATAMLHEQAAALFEGMHVRMIVEPQGEIAETSATFREDDAVVLFDLDMSALLEHPEQLVALQVAGTRSPTEMKELLSDIPGLQVEPQETVTVVFE